MKIKVIHKLITTGPTLTLLLLLSLLLPTLSTASDNNNNNNEGGLWGTLKSATTSATRPVRVSLQRQYKDLSDRGKFGVGAAVGFGCSRMAVGTTVKAVKTVGAAYIAFEALEYAGLLKEARINAKKSKLYNNRQNQQLLAQTRDYILNTMDGLRRDIRTHLHPSAVKKYVEKSMEKDRAGTTGFATGAFLGFVL